MDTFTSSFSLSLYIIELSEKISALDDKRRKEYLEYIQYEFFAMDDEFSIIFETIIQILNCEKEKIEIFLNNLSENGADLFKLELCVKACLDYLEDIN